MQIGAVLPHNEIGTDPGAIVAYAQGLEELGVANLLIYDHVLGADRDRPGGFEGPYDKDVAFHEPFTLLQLRRRRDDDARAGHRRADPPAAPDRARRQAGRRGGRAVGQPLPPRRRHRLERRRVRRAQRALLQPRPPPGRAGRADAPAVVRGDVVVRRRVPHRSTRPGINPRPAAPIPIWFGGSAPAVLERCARLGDGWLPLGTPNDDVARAHRRPSAPPARRPGCRWTASPSRPRRSTPAAIRTAGARTPSGGASSARRTCRSPPTTPGRRTSTGTCARVAEYQAAVAG